LLVPPDASCAVSTVSVIRRLEEAGPEMPATDPLRLDRMRIVPNFDLPISKAQNKNISVYVVIYATPGATAAPKMSLEFMQGDRLIARAMPSLGAPDKDGRIRSSVPSRSRPSPPVNTACGPWCRKAKMSRSRKRR
jgi:hypothetical protein